MPVTNRRRRLDRTADAACLVAVQPGDVQIHRRSLPACCPLSPIRAATTDDSVDQVSERRRCCRLISLDRPQQRRGLTIDIVLNPLAGMIQGRAAEPVVPAHRLSCRSLAADAGTSI